MIQFCFVSIDADLYEPILSGLQFFYPKLEQKATYLCTILITIFIKAARKAVIEFCAANNIGYLPIPDSGGTAIITK